MCYGSDWRYGIQTGLEDYFQNVADPYGLVFPQIYLEVAYNNLSVKLGHFAGNFYELTIGATWKPRPNIMLRPECRWDWYSGNNGTGVYALPFDAGTKDNQFTFAMDLIVSY